MEVGGPHASCAQTLSMSNCSGHVGPMLGSCMHERLMPPASEPCLWAHAALMNVGKPHAYECMCSPWMQKVPISPAAKPNLCNHVRPMEAGGPHLLPETFLLTLCWALGVGDPHASCTQTISFHVGPTGAGGTPPASKPVL